jgi:uncharacterized membrane protein (UPF0136 family)
MPAYALGALVIGTGFMGFYSSETKNSKQALQLAGAALVGGPLLMSGLLIQLKSQSGYFLATSISASLSFYNSMRYASTQKPMPLVVMVLSGATGCYYSVLWYLFSKEEDDKKKL